MTTRVSCPVLTPLIECDMNILLDKIAIDHAWHSCRGRLSFHAHKPSQQATNRLASLSRQSQRSKAFSREGHLYRAGQDVHLWRRVSASGTRHQLSTRLDLLSSARMQCSPTLNRQLFSLLLCNRSNQEIRCYTRTGLPWKASGTPKLWHTSPNARKQPGKKRL